MDIKISKNDVFRVYSDYERDNFIDVCSIGHESIKLTAYPYFTNIQVRKKNNVIGIFFFKEKEYLFCDDEKWWEDAEIIFEIKRAKNV